MSSIPTHLPTASLLVANMHCPSCVESITQLLADLPSVRNLSVSLLLQGITFGIDTSVSSSTRPTTPEKVIEQVKSILTTQGGFVITDENHESHSDDSTPPPTKWNWLGKRRENKAQRLAAERRRRHLERCAACRAEQEALDRGIAPPTVSAPPPADQVLVSTLSIEGMTCASCTGSITKALEGHPSILSVDINLLSSAGTVRHKAKLPASEVIELVDDSGFAAELMESHPEANPDVAQDDPNRLMVTNLSIDGMTCASCSSSIDSALRGTPDIVDISINLLGNKGTVTHKASLSAEAVKHLIEDAGFGAEVVTSAPVEQTAAPTDSRTITVRVQGVFCNNCIDQLNAHLKEMPVRSFTPLTLASPVTTITYVPHVPLTIRSILKSLSAVAPEFDAEIVRTQSLSERSQAIQKREVKLLATHLAVAVIFAIPTFIIAIVSMVLLRHSSPFRQGWERPVWGGANLGTVVLWPLATVVQFGVGHIFYRRAFNSIWPHLRSILPSFLRPASMSRMPTRPLTWRSLFSFGSMDLLVCLSTTVSYFASVAMMALDIKAEPGTMSIGSYFDACVFLIMFILLGRTLEAYAKSRTTDAVSLLGTLRPPTAWLVDEAGLDEKKRVSLDSENHSDSDSETLPAREIPVEHVEYGDILLVQPGALPPTDGVIVSGTTKFDESSLTGESLPVTKAPGDEVFTGTTNQSSAINIRVTSLASDTMLERIIRAVSDASGRKAPLEKAAERLTGVFVPIVVYIAIVVLAIWLAVTYSGLIDPSRFHGSGGAAFFAIEFAISVLVVACPCGIGLAVPCANAVGTGLAAAAGILASGGGEAFTSATGINTVAFDKTGTLTVGKSVVTAEHEETTAIDRALVMRAVRDVEAQSTHPLAVGLVEYLADRVPSGAAAEIVESAEIAGRGLRATVSVGGSTIEMLIGNAALLTENDVPFSAENTDLIHTWSNDAKSVILVGARPSGLPVEEAPFALAAMYALSDPPRETTRGVLDTLRARGYRVLMLSGDNEATARAVGRMVGIDEKDVRGGVGPEGKADAIAALQAEVYTPARRWWQHRAPKPRRTRVMFVGDGLNDAVALAAADVSAAMGHGSQATLASADFVLLSSNLESLIKLLHLSRKVRNRQWFNLFWAMIFNTVCLPIAAGILYPAGGIKLSPVWSAVLMALSSVSVVLSSLALRWGL